MVELSDEVVVVKNVGHRFVKGHPRYPGAGRAKGSKNKGWSRSLREIAESRGFHPLEVALVVIQTGRLPTEGEKEAVKVSVEERLKCLRDVMRYLVPTLSAVQLSGANEGPITVAPFDLMELIKNPELAAAAQKLALGIVGARGDEPLTP